MSKLKVVPIILLVAGLFAAGIAINSSQAAERGAKIKAQTVCPVLGGAIDKRLYVDYKGYRIYFCCDGCPEEFKKNPEKYMKKLRESGVTLEKTPSGS
jgi:YHS domain-containing protein